MEALGQLPVGSHWNPIYDCGRRELRQRDDLSFYRDWDRISAIRRQHRDDAESHQSEQSFLFIGSENGCLIVPVEEHPPTSRWLSRHHRQPIRRANG